MFRSVKSQIIAATSIILIVILGATAFLVLREKAREINHDIFVKALSFAELTHERIAVNYENNYQEKAFANFEREMAEIKSLNTDIAGVSIFNYQGESLIEDEAMKEERIDAKDPDQRDRLQAVIPSLQVKKSGRIVYVEKKDGKARYANFNGKSVEPIRDTEQIATVVYPFRDPNNVARSFSVVYGVSYDALQERIRGTVIKIGILALAGIAISLLTGGIVAGRITSPIRALSQGAEKIGQGDFKTRIHVQTHSEVGMLATTFNHMAEDLEKSTQVLIEKEKLSRELQLAGEIQQELLPKKLPIIPNLDIAASLHSAEDVGGDCYDFLISKEGQLLFYVADVTGHGVPAGLVSAINNALVPALMDHYSTTKELVDHLNVILKMKTRPNVFMTMVMATWETKQNKLSFTQAGHDPILHYSASAKTVKELPTGGMALGMIPDLTKVTRTESVAVSAGDLLVLYTDGIPEAWKNEKETYGMPRLKESIQKNSGLRTAQEIHDAILKDTRDFMGSYPQQDDITLLVVKKTA